jgi:hypothetical protein
MRWNKPIAAISVDFAAFRATSRYRVVNRRRLRSARKRHPNNAATINTCHGCSLMVGESQVPSTCGHRSINVQASSRVLVIPHIRAIRIVLGALRVALVPLTDKPEPLTRDNPTRQHIAEIAVGDADEVTLLDVHRVFPGRALLLRVATTPCSLA